MKFGFGIIINFPISQIITSQLLFGCTLFPASMVRFTPLEYNKKYKTKKQQKIEEEEEDQEGTKWNRINHDGTFVVVNFHQHHGYV